jgi:hypothetical protein
MIPHSVEENYGRQSIPAQAKADVLRSAEDEMKERLIEDDG